MSGNKQFVTTRACMLFITRNRSMPTYRYALWRAYRQLRHRQSCLRRSALSYEGRKISALLAKKFSTTTPSFLHVFGRAPGGLLCVVEFESVAPLLRYSICKYTLTLKPGLEVTQGHRKLYHSIRRP